MIGFLFCNNISNDLNTITYMYARAQKREREKGTEFFFGIFNK